MGWEERLSLKERNGVSEIAAGEVVVESPYEELRGSQGIIITIIMIIIIYVYVHTYIHV